MGQARSLLTEACRRLRNAPGRLQEDVEILQREFWARMLAEGTRIENNWASLAVNVSGDCKPDILALRHNLPFGFQAMHQIQLELKRLQPDGRSECQCGTPIRVALGSPSTMGCTDLRGSAIRLKTLVNSKTSVQTAMRELGLDIVALPGARLRSSPGYGFSNQCARGAGVV